MRQRSFLNASLAVLALAILALAVLAFAQDYAGITRAEVTFEDGALAAVTFIGGKESQRMRWMLHGPNGLSAYYEAHDLRAFDGRALRAQVHGILVGAGVKGAGRLIDMIIRRLRR